MLPTPIQIIGATELLHDPSQHSFRLRGGLAIDEFWSSPLFPYRVKKSDRILRLYPGITFVIGMTVAPSLDKQRPVCSKHEVL